MSMSGIKISDELLKDMHDIKSKKNVEYLVMKLDPDAQLVVKDEDIISPKRPAEDTALDAKNRFYDMLEKLDRLNEPRYIMYDLHLDPKDNGPGQLVFIFWCMESTKVKLKMTYSTTMAAVKKQSDTEKFSAIEFRDKNDYTFESILEIVRQKSPSSK